MDGVNDCLKGINKEASNAQAYEELKDRFVVWILMYLLHTSLSFNCKISRGGNISSSSLDCYLKLKYIFYYYE